MGELINKVTLYDVISFTIPGSILLSLFGYFVFDLNDDFFKCLDNFWIIFLLIICSYCIGWIFSEFMNLFYSVIFNIKINYRNVIFLICLLVCLVFIHITKLLNAINILKLLYLLFIFFLLVIAIKRLIDKNANSKDSIEKKLLEKKYYACLKKEYKNFDKAFKDNNKYWNIKEKVTEMSKSSYMLVQTDSKYSRLHNYNSSKSFTKNLSGVVLVILLLLCYQFLANNNSTKMKFLESMMMLCVGAFYVLGKRYISFKNKFNILTITYCIDYFENKTKKKIQNK
ncbi:hypothetical protein [Thomasclavelia spiroformis]|uniref:hypothetical protein n=1 Tax=Thomasclavelia spiroformis TaxID=29348 RepID=UPI002675A275|nr:hypothetical protein [Thomasclavelia spiroformis]